MSKNINMQRQGNKLVIEIDLAKKGEPSKSGKTLLVATTGSAVPVPGLDGGSIGLNLYVPNPDYVPEPKGQRKA